MTKKYNDLEFDIENSPYKETINDMNIINKCPIVIKITDKNTCKNLKLIETVSKTKKELAHTNAIEMINTKYKNHYNIYTDKSIISQNGNRGIGIFHQKPSKKTYVYKIKNPISFKSTEAIGVIMAMEQSLSAKESKVAISTHSLSTVKSLIKYINSNKTMKIEF